MSIELKNVTYTYSQGTAYESHALKDINLVIPDGQFIGVIGHTGSGKSTLIQHFNALIQPTSGQILYNGEDVWAENYNRRALRSEVGLVFQYPEHQLFENTVLADVCFGPMNQGLSREQAEEEAKKALAHVGVKEENFTKSPFELSGGQKKRVAIAGVLAMNPKILILDEPTSSLTAPEVAKLFKMMRQLKAQGISLIYISHKMDEIFEICDEISVLRDGSLVMTKESKDTNMNELISAMVGRSLDNRFPPVDNTPGETVLSVQNLSTKYAPKLQNISFDIRKGEIFGLYGLVGAGRTELLETIFGMRTRAAGNVIYNGKTMNFSSPKDAMDHGFALITEERKANGLFLKADITFNTTIANMNHYKSGIALSHDSMVRATAEEIKVMHTKCMGPDDMISSLSGGNQQKAIFGKWLERSPNIFMMDDPTRGIDVGAKYEIYELIINMAKQGKTIIVVSSEMPEILGITNRIGVMSNGHLAGIVNTKETNQEELLRLSAKYL